MPILIVIATIFAVIGTAGLALPLLALVALAVICRRPSEVHNPLAIAALPGRRCTPVEVSVR